MIDFEKIREDLEAGMTPEQRERLARFEEREAQWERDSVEIPATFQATRWREPVAAPVRRGSMLGGSMWAKPPTPARGREREVEVVRTWEKPVRMGIERRDGGEESYEILRFRNAVTGHEAYRLDEDFCASLADPEDATERPGFAICAGTPDRWYSCEVRREDVVAFLRQRRPHLFPGHEHEAEAEAPGRKP